MRRSAALTPLRGRSTPGSSAGHLTRSPCRAGWSIRCSSGSIARTDCAGNLDISQRTVGPSCLRLPTLALVNTADEIAPLASIKPFFDAMPGADVCVLEFPGEVGVGLQHLGILVGRQAYAQVWPEIISWLKARC